MEIYKRTDFIKLTLSFGRQQREWRGAPQLRPEKDADAAFNPSRTLALLERRGLVRRDASRVLLQSSL